jgi:uncharacterized protein (TIGR02757 family)
MMTNIKKTLDCLVERYNTPDFILNDPISVPHRFQRAQDIEIMAFWTAILAWGQRKVIIQKALLLADLMDNSPYDFIKNAKEKDWEKLYAFKHRTFQTTDTLYFGYFLQQYYQKFDSLETAFARHLSPQDTTIEKALIGFHTDFFDSPFAPERTRKHISTPSKNAACKRLCMFLRWMVRQDNNGVDFGLWTTISPHQLLMPVDVHVERNAKLLGLVRRDKPDWKMVLELTENLRQFDPHDPVKYDFALFGMGVYDESF